MLELRVIIICIYRYHRNSYLDIRKYAIIIKYVVYGMINFSAFYNKYITLNIILCIV